MDKRNVTVVGGGKVGFYLLKALIERDYEPTAIEIDRDTCAYLANELDIPVICGDGTQLEVLDAANVAESRALICVTGNDEDNLVACQLAKKIFNVPKTVAKVNNPRNADVLETLGVDNVINSTDRIASLIEREVDTSKIKQLIELNHGDAAIYEITLPEDYVLDGVQLMNIKIPALFNIVSITRHNRLIIPRGQSELRSGDRLMVISDSSEIGRLNSVLKLK